MQPGKSTEILARSLGGNNGMFRADSLVDMAFLLALKVIQHIPTQNIKIAAPGDLVPEVFQLNRRLRLPLRP